MNNQENNHNRLLWHTFFQFSGAGPYFCWSSQESLGDYWNMRYTDEVLKFLPWSYILGVILSFLLYFCLNKLMKQRYQTFIIPVIKVQLLYASFFFVEIVWGDNGNTAATMWNYETMTQLFLTFLQGFFSFWLLCSTTRFVFNFGRTELLLYTIGIFLPQIFDDILKFSFAIANIKMKNWLYMYLMFPTIIVMPICLVYYSFISKYSQKIEEKYSKMGSIGDLLDDLVNAETVNTGGVYKNVRSNTDLSDNTLRQVTICKKTISQKKLDEIIPESESFLNEMINDAYKSSLQRSSDGSLSRSSISKDHKKLREKVRRALSLNKQPENIKRKSKLACSTLKYLLCYHAAFALFFLFSYTQLISTQYQNKKYKSLIDIIGVCFQIIGTCQANFLFKSLIKKQKIVFITFWIYISVTLALYIIYRCTLNYSRDSIGYFIIINYSQLSFGAGFYSMLSLLFLMKIQFKKPDDYITKHVKTDIGFLVACTMYSGIAHSYLWYTLVFNDKHLRL